jgi:N-acetylmuramoyl-L-alanine amidase
MAGFFLTGIAGNAIAKQQLFEAYRRVIVIDPGHGGDEPGAVGPDSASEKAVTLNLAQLLAAELQREYKVALTRSDDSTLDLDQRTALANHHQADLFISIHTGGSFVHHTSGMSIYHYQDFSEAPPPHKPDKNTPILWDRAQTRHLAKSRELAGLIGTRLGRLEAVEERRIQGAPLLLLQAANMPAVLIEIGYLTNPAEGKKLSDQRFLTDLAREIRRAIDEYFEQER